MEAKLEESPPPSRENPFIFDDSPYEFKMRTLPMKSRDKYLSQAHVSKVIMKASSLNRHKKEELIKMNTSQSLSEKVIPYLGTRDNPQGVV